MLITAELITAELITAELITAELITADHADCEAGPGKGGMRKPPRALAVAEDAPAGA